MLLIKEGKDASGPRGGNECRYPQKLLHCYREAALDFATSQGQVGEQDPVSTKTRRIFD